MTERRPLILRADTALPRLQELPVGDLLPTDTLGNAIKVLLQGLVTGNNAGITSTDTVLEAFGKLQAQTSAKVDKDGAKVLSDNNFTNAERVKLANIADGASNDRSKHTGTQSISTVSSLQAELDAKATVLSVSQAISMAETFTAVPTTFQSWVIFVTQPHFRTFVWNGTRYVRAPWHRPGIIFHSDAPAANITHGIQMRSDVTYNVADYPDLAEVYGFTGSTFVLKDARARVIRGADLGKGVDTALVNGYLQEDAIRNITGEMYLRDGAGRGIGRPDGYSGALTASAATGVIANPALGATESGQRGITRFDASLSVPTASENRVKSLIATPYVTI